MTKFTINGITYPSRLAYFLDIEPMRENEKYKSYYIRMCKKCIPGFHEKCNEITCTMLAKRYREDINFCNKKIKQAQDRYMRNKINSQQLQLVY